MSSRELVILAFLCSCCGNRSGNSSSVSSSSRDDHGEVGVVYEDSIPESEELMGVSHEGNWGYINRRGELVVPFQFVSVSQFKDGKAVVEAKGDDWTRFKYIDNTGKVTGDLSPPRNKKSFGAEGDVGYANMTNGVEVLRTPEQEEDEADGMNAGKPITIVKNTEGITTTTVNMFKGKWVPVMSYGDKKWILDLYLINFNPNCKAAQCETWVLTKSNKADDTYSQTVLQRMSSGALSLRIAGSEKSTGKATFPGLSIGQVFLYYFMTNPGLKGFTMNRSLQVTRDKNCTLTFSLKRDQPGNLKSLSLTATSPRSGKCDFDFVQESDGVSVTESFGN